MSQEIRRLAETTTGQRGVVTRAHVAAAGLTGEQLRHRIESGVFEPIGSHT